MSNNLGETLYIKYKEGFTLFHLSDKFGLSVNQIKKIISDYKKEINLYNEDHIKEKYKINSEFYFYIKPKTILDLFCGRNRYWSTFFSNFSMVISNDNLEDPYAKPDPGYSFNASDLLEKFRYENKKFDLIDIDPYGSPSECIDLGIELADKGLIITIGDYKNALRYPNKFKNYFSKTYGINKPIGQINIDSFIDLIETKSSGKFEVFDICSWKTCDRIYFKNVNL